MQSVSSPGEWALLQLTATWIWTVRMTKRELEDCLTAGAAV